MDEIKVIDMTQSNYSTVNSFVNSLNIQEFKNNEMIFKLIKELRSDNRKNINKIADKLENKYHKYIEEIQRVSKMYDFDVSFGEFKCIAGIDEVGRGPLAGPIAAAAVVLDYSKLDNDLILGLNDSKKISPDKREMLYEEITSKALSYNISEIDNVNIDNRGIAFCNNEVFIKAYEGLSLKPDFILTDGYPIKGRKLNNESVIKGDTKSACIAAASIIAKVYRDRLMKQYALQYPQYAFDKNAGYGTKEHIEALKTYGVTPIHRNSFLRGILDEKF